MKFIKKNFVVIVLLFIICTTVSLPLFKTFAGDDATVVKITNPIKANTINDFIKQILVGVLKIGIPIIALAIIYSGFLFVSARGNSKELETAKKALMYSLIGAAILLGSWAIAQIISETILKL